MVALVGGHRLAFPLDIHALRSRRISSASRVGAEGVNPVVQTCWIDDVSGGTTRGPME
jgi:hypothetical protein